MSDAPRSLRSGVGLLVVDLICGACGEWWVARAYDDEPLSEDAYKCHCGGMGKIA